MKREQPMGRGTSFLLLLKQMTINTVAHSNITFLYSLGGQKSDTFLAKVKAMFILRVLGESKSIN